MRRVGIVGTPDLGNFGDMLFPDLAERALHERLGEVELEVFGFRRVSGDGWPRHVHPVSALPERLDELGLLLIGGGDLVRFDRPLAPGYGPTDLDTHDPTGLWLAPTLAAAAHGVPVVWNAIGVRGEAPAWGRLLGAAAARAASLVAVRDGASAGRLAELAPGTTPRVLPDTAFGVRAQIPAEESEELKALRQRGELPGRYVIVQAAPQLVPFAAHVAAFAGAARDEGLAVVELPISPALGDREGLLESTLGQTVGFGSWPPPLVLAELIARAEAVVAQSLHLSIVAVSCGVPVHRPAGAEGEKYEIVNGLPGVEGWEAPDGDAPITLGRGEPSVSAVELAAQVAGHWDDVAALATAAAEPAPRAALDGLLARLPHEMAALVEIPPSTIAAAVAAAVAEAEREREQIRAARDELERHRDEIQAAKDEVDAHALALEKRVVELETLEVELRRQLAREARRPYSRLRAGLGGGALRDGP